MRHVLILVLVAWAVAADVRPTAGAERRSGDPPDAWSQVLLEIHRGDRLVVTRRDMTHVDGRVVSIDTAGLTVLVDGTERTVAVDDVAQLRVRGDRRRHVLVGIAVGAVAGAVGTVLIDQQSSHPSTKREAATIGAIVIGAPAGALAGALWPAGHVVYVAPGSPR
ncbi:MAG: hypothetical protein JSU08_13740 [Acidobacteria bacterium]|nr:hypothetical protein [Acidobacteriota bacterium]